MRLWNLVFIYFFFGVLPYQILPVQATYKFIWRHCFYDSVACIHITISEFMYQLVSQAHIVKFLDPYFQFMHTQLSDKGNTKEPFFFFHKKITKLTFLVDVSKYYEQ